MTPGASLALILQTQQLADEVCGLLKNRRDEDMYHRVRDLLTEANLLIPDVAADQKIEMRLVEYSHEGKMQ